MRTLSARELELVAGGDGSNPQWLGDDIGWVDMSPTSNGDNLPWHAWTYQDTWGDRVFSGPDFNFLQNGHLIIRTGTLADGDPETQTVSLNWYGPGTSSSSSSTSIVTAAGTVGPHGMDASGRQAALDSWVTSHGATNYGYIGDLPFESITYNGQDIGFYNLYAASYKGYDPNDPQETAPLPGGSNWVDTTLHPAHFFQTIGELNEFLSGNTAYQSVGAISPLNGHGTILFAGGVDGGLGSDYQWTVPYVTSTGQMSTYEVTSSTYIDFLIGHERDHAMNGIADEVEANSDSLFDNAFVSDANNFRTNPNVGDESGKTGGSGGGGGSGHGTQTL